MSLIYLRREGSQSTEQVTDRNPFPVEVRGDYSAGVRFTEVASDTADKQAVAAGNGLRLMGCTARESAAGPATAEVYLRHGTTATDPVMAFYDLNADESVRDWFGPDGLECPGGIFVDRVSGTTHLTVYWKLVEVGHAGGAL